MTTIIRRIVTCSICGGETSGSRIGSCTTSGSSDLDLRPPEMARSTIYSQIQRCPSCGYCSLDISKCDDKTEEIVNSKEYQDIIKNREMPEVAASFLALSYENEKQQKYALSASSAIRAAWICDDSKNIEAAVRCRKQAITLIEKANSAGEKIAEQAGVSELITIDLMRRSGMYNEALEVIAAMKAEDAEELIWQLINYQKKLIAEKDTVAHLISEALDD